MPRGNGGIIGPVNTSFSGVWSLTEAQLRRSANTWPNFYAALLSESATGSDVFSGADAADPYFEYTTLLLPGNGTNGAQNNTFLDGSTNNFTITRNGNTTQGNFTPFSQTGWSGAFNTSTTYLTVTDTSNLRFGSSNFTIEAFVYRAASGATQTIASKGASTPTGWVFQISSADKLVFTDTSTSITGATSLAANTWYYVAVVRAGTGSNQTTLYVNAVSDATGTSATTFSQTDNMKIGADRSNTNFANGYISNLRLSNTNRTISSTPTSALTADANTIFLGLYNNRFQYTDSTAAFTNMSVTGSPSIQAFSPFNPTASWSAATYGGSGYFDGSGDYLTAGVASNWTFLHNGSDWTCEFWVYHTGTNLYGIVSTTAFSAETGMSVFVNNTGSSGLVNGLQVYVTRGASGFQAVFNSTALLAINQWNYVAITFTSSTKTCSFTINGASAGSSSDTGFLYSASNPTNTLAVGRYQGSTPGGYLLGYISSLRISTNVRTGLTSVPTAPYTSDANTKLLLNFTNAGIYDATSKNDLETVGNAQISTTQSKWGGSSMYFDGTGDYLQAPDTELLEFGSGNFTIETWVRFAALPSSGAYQTLISKFDNSTQKSYLFYVYNNAGTYQLYFTYTTNGSTNVNPVANGITVATNTWYHYAVCRSGANLRMFIDGTQVGSTYNISTDSIFGGTYPVQVGATTASNVLNGFLQDTRVTKGYARYTANFTPPTAAFPTL